MKISQREARRMRKELAALKEAERIRRNYYNRDYPGGIHLITFIMNDETKGSLTAASRLGHPLVAKVDEHKLRIYAIQ